MKNVMQKKFFIPLIAVFVVLACIVTAVCVLADKEAETMNTRPETNESASESVKEPVSEPITEPPTEEPTEPQPTEPKTEPTTEPQTTAPTEPVTEPITEAQTEPITEAPTVPPTEPVTETPTEPEIEFMIKARDTAPDGEPIEFNVAVNQRCSPNISMLNGESSKLGFYSHVFQTCSNFRDFLTDGFRDPYYKDRDEFSCYTDEYFKNNALIVLIITRPVAPLEQKINAVTKNGSEICISISAEEKVPGKGYMCMIQHNIILIEIDKDVLSDADTLSHYVTSW